MRQPHGLHPWKHGGYPYSAAPGIEASPSEGQEGGRSINLLENEVQVGV